MLRLPTRQAKLTNITLCLVGVAFQLYNCKAFIDSLHPIRSMCLNISGLYVLPQALRASYEGLPAEEAWHLLKAGQWNRSHTIVLRHLAADDIIHGQFMTTVNHVLLPVSLFLNFTCPIYILILKMTSMLNLDICALFIMNEI